MRSSIVSAEGFNPSNRGRTFSDDPKHPLWKIQVKFPTTKPMVELIKAPTKTAAIQYAKTKYPESEVFLLMDTPVRR
jgi:hypothetical protein